MKLKLVVVDLQLTRRQKMALSFGVVGAFALTAAVASADVEKTFATGETLKAADLNANFDAMDGRLTDVDAAVAGLQAGVTDVDAAVAGLEAGLTDVDAAVAALETGGPALKAGATSSPAYVGGVVNPSATQMRWQAASVTSVTNAQGVATVAYPSAFSNGVLTVMAVNGDGAFGGSETFSVLSGTTSVFSIKVQDTSGAPVANQVRRFNWVAIGW